MDQTIEVIEKTPEEFWRAHLEAARDFKGTGAAYCRLKNLDRRKFSFYKRRLGFSKSREAIKVFAEIKPKVDEVPKSIRPALSSRAFPDAKWLAEFTLSLLGGQNK